MQEKKQNDWDRLLAKMKEIHGEEPQIDSILFLIGVQELGMGYKKFKKDDKVNIMHIAICTLLEPYGFYVFDGRDKDGWPHWTLKENLPPLDSKQQNKLMVGAIIDYFKNNGMI
ncbi:MAG: hypothetical protein K0S33_1684 [Bacteroidetes bacterium]|nr:hypothetical protein [Bacteroidota bacterium]